MKAFPKERTWFPKEGNIGNARGEKSNSDFPSDGVTAGVHGIDALESSEWIGFLLISKRKTRLS